MTSVWEKVRAAAGTTFRFVLRYPVAVVVTLALLAVAVLVSLYGKPMQIGGLLGRLWGTKKAPSARGTVPSERTGEDRAPVIPGESDDRGWVQAPVSTEIVEPGILSDPSEIEVVHPDKGRVVIALPEGVQNTDVQEVVELRPDVYEVRNKDGGKSAKEIDDLLKKLGG